MAQCSLATIFINNPYLQGRSMSSTVKSHKGNLLTIEMTIELGGSMLDMENHIQDELNLAGQLATIAALKTFDTDGSPIIVSKTKLTARKEKASQHYESPYGSVHVDRYLYQSNEGGYTYCPLEDGARIIITSTPRFAQIVSDKYSRMPAGDVVEDLFTSSRRDVSRRYVPKLAEAVATIAQLKEDAWEYDLPQLESPVASIGIGIDGTYVLIKEEGWREAMSGTIALYDKKGNRLHTAYIAASPEYGKQQFHDKMSREIERVKVRFPKARTLGLGDGAKQNWTFLEQHTDEQALDFWHTSQYVHKVADAYWGFSEKWKDLKEEWLEKWHHILKYDDSGATKLLSEFKMLQKELRGAKSDTVQKSITYFENHLLLMNYGSLVKRRLPIGSGVTEAACKAVVKARCSISGAGWTHEGVGMVLTLRTLKLSEGNWDSFWSKLSRYGVPYAKLFGKIAEKNNIE
jgi:hypothetical protein